MLICESWLIFPMTIAYMEIVTVIIFLSARVLKHHTFTPNVMIRIITFSVYLPLLMAEGGGGTAPAILAHV